MSIETPGPTLDIAVTKFFPGNSEFLVDELTTDD